MVYMRPEYHERIQRIISVIGNNQLNIWRTSICQ